MKKFILIILLLISFNVKAEEYNDEVYESNIYNLVNTLLRYSDEFILTDRQLMDSYIALNYCDTNEGIFRDEIGRNDLRNELVKKILAEKDSYPHIYKVAYPVFIDQYDFDNQKLIINDKSTFDNVSQIGMQTNNLNNHCLSDYPKLLKDYYVDLQGFINLKEIPMTVEKARKIVPQMLFYQDKQVFIVVLTVDLTDILLNNRSEAVFVGDVLDIGYYTQYGDEYRFGTYDFAKENKDIKSKDDYLKDLNFTVPEQTTY